MEQSTTDFVPVPHDVELSDVIHRLKAQDARIRWLEADRDDLHTYKTTMTHISIGFVGGILYSVIIFATMKRT
jgi:hypothetical protein